MKTKIKLGMIGVALLACTSAANAVSFTVNPCGGVGTPTCPTTVSEQAVFYNQGPNGNVIGNIGSQTGQPVFTISSPDGALTAQGFAQIGLGNSTTNDVTFTANGFTFADLIFAVRGTGNLSVTDQTGASAINGTQLLTSGQNTFLAITQTAAALFTSLTLSTTGVFEQIGQVRVSGVSAVPLPGALFLMGTGLAGLAGFGAARSRRRQRASALAA